MCIIYKNLINNSELIMDLQEISMDYPPESQFQQSYFIPKSSHQHDTDVDAYLTQFLNVQLFRQDSRNLSSFLIDDGLEKSTLFRFKNQAENEFSSLQDEENQENINNFNSIQMEQKDTYYQKKQRRERPTDHNVCKKFHTIANKCLRNLKIYNFIKSESKKIHKRNYFILVLIVAEKTKKFHEFKKLYSKKIKEEVQRSLQIVRASAPDSSEHKHNLQLIQSINCSLTALEIYEKGHLYEAVLKLFNVVKMKRQGWIQQAFAQVSKFGQTIQLVLERVLTRF